MGKKLKRNEKKKSKILKTIDKLKNKITAKEKKLSKVNIKIAGLEKKVAEKKETTFQSAHKELTEETGYKSRSKLIKIITFYSEPGRLTTKITVYYT